MKAGQSGGLIRSIHKWTGLGLILLIAAKLVSGFTMAGAIEFVGDRMAGLLHFSKWIDVPLVIGFTIHALYGILRAFWSRIQSKDLAFYITSVLALLISIWGLTIIY